MTSASLSSSSMLSPSLPLTPVVAAPTSGKSMSKNLGGWVEASPRAATAARGGNCCSIFKRRGGGGGGGMNPHGILTGLGGQRDEVVQRTVYDGALRMEDSPHAIVRDALADYLLGNVATATAADGGGGGTQRRL